MQYGRCVLHQLVCGCPDIEYPGHAQDEAGTFVLAKSKLVKTRRVQYGRYGFTS